MKLLKHFDINKYGWSLAISIVLYFVLSRIFQNWFYHLRSLDLRPAGLFENFGPQFFQAEPLEIYLYIASYFLIPLLSILLYPAVRRFNFHKFKINKRKLLYGVITVGLLGGLVVLWKMPWELFINYIQDKGIWHIIWLLATKRIFVSYIIIGMTTIFLVVYFFIDKKIKLENLFKTKLDRCFRKLQPLFFIILAALLFHPNFPVDPHHYNYFLGAVNDIYQGKALLYESSHLYGLFDIYFLLPIFKLIQLNYVNFSLIITFSFLIFFIGVYIFLRRWLNSYTLATLGTAVTLAVIYFFQVSPTRSALFFPNMSPFRLGLYVIVLFLILGFWNTQKNRYLHLALLVSAFAFFWNYDSGVFLSVATLLTFAYHYWVKDKDILAIIKTAVYYLFYLGAMFVVVNLVNHGIYGDWPNWSLFFRETDEFVFGAGMYPLPAVGIYQIIYFVYMAVLLGAVWALRKKDKFNLPLLFLGLYGAFSFIYYVGESTWQLLYSVAVPFILIIFYLFKNYNKRKIARLGFMGLLVFGFLFLIFKVPVELYYRDYGLLKSSLLEVQAEDMALYEDAQWLKSNVPQKRIPLLMFADDTKLLIYAEKANYFDFYYTFTVYFEDDMQKYIDQVLEEKPPTIYIGKIKNDQIEYFLSGLGNEYEVISSLNTLDVYAAKD